MKKIFEKHGVLRCIGALVASLAVVLLVVAAFIKDTATADMILKILGVLFLVIGGMILAIRSEKHQLIKSILVLVIAAILLTWLFPYGYFQGSDFYKYEMSRVGLTDIGFAIYSAVNFIIDKIAILLVITGFYGVLSKVNGYQKLIENIAKKAEKHVIVTSVIISIILFVLTSLFTQTFVILIFIPFFISVLLKMNLDKFTTFAITFGSALVGILGCTYGTDSMMAFNRYLNQTVNTGLQNRFIIAAVALVLYNFFLVMRIRKVTKETKKNTKNNELKDDPFMVDTAKKKASSIPVAIILGISAIIIILGYVNWEANFNITIFNSFHEWLTGLTVGEDFAVMSYILGGNAEALGSFTYVFNICYILLISSALIAFLYKMKLSEYLDAFYEGNKQMLRPVLFLIGAYAVFGVCYLSPIIPSVVDFLANLVKGFNPYITSVIAFISSVFQADFGYTAYTIGGLITTTYAGNLDLAHAIFTSMYGLVQIFMPTSALLVVGLSMMKIDYKDWLKYIWLFVVGIIVILLVLFTVVTYI